LADVIAANGDYACGEDLDLVQFPELEGGNRPYVRIALCCSTPMELQVYSSRILGEMATSICGCCGEEGRLEDVTTEMTILLPVCAACEKQHTTARSSGRAKFDRGERRTAVTALAAKRSADVDAAGIKAEAAPAAAAKLVARSASKPTAPTSEDVDVDVMMTMAAPPGDADALRAAANVLEKVNLPADAKTLRHHALLEPEMEIETWKRIVDRFKRADVALTGGGLSKGGPLGATALPLIAPPRDDDGSLLAELRAADGPDAQEHVPILIGLDELDEGTVARADADTSSPKRKRRNPASLCDDAMHKNDDSVPEPRRHRSSRKASASAKTATDAARG